MGDDRRLKIAKRQLTLAQIARREARHALANAIAEEERSGDVYARSRDLLSEYSKRVVRLDADALSQSLRNNLGFVRSLQVMADNAGQAHKDAREQAEWQMQALAAAESRMNTHEDRVSEETRALTEVKARRDLPPELTSGAGMARKLQKAQQEHQQTAEKPAASHNSATPSADLDGA